MATENGTFSNARVIRHEITVDPELNSRKILDPKKIERLAQSIKVQGVINPALLIRSGQLGGKYLEAGKPYVLIAGFRRQSAMDLNATAAGIALEEQDADYRIAPIGWTLQDAITANLTENLAREDLSTFELAMQCVELRDVFAMSAKDIAAKVRAHDSEAGDRKPLSESHLNNLMRCVTQLHPDIIKAWQEQNPKASLRFLIKLASIEDSAEQLREWRGENETKEEPESKPRDKKTDEAEEEEEEREKGRPTVAKLTMMIEAVKLAVKADKRDPDWGKGAIAALRYAAGLTQTLPGVKPEELEAAED